MRTSRSTTLFLVLGCLFVASGAWAHGEGTSRVIVSTTLNSTLHVIHGADLEETQPPLFSRGGGPVRLWIDQFGSTPVLLTANHGIAGSSVGVFDLSEDLVTEMPASPAPAPAGAGAVGITAGAMKVGEETVPMVFLGNSYFALAPCSAAPSGNVTAYDASLAATGGTLLPVGTVETGGALAWGVAADEENGLVFATSNCEGTLETIAVTPEGSLKLGPVPVPDGVPALMGLQHVDSRPSGAGTDAVIFDQERGLAYATNISADNLAVLDATSPAPLTVVPIPDGGPIDANFGVYHVDGEPEGGREYEWIVTSNGQNDTAGVIDRDIIDECIQNGEPSCDRALVAQVATDVPGGAPEGIDYDPVTKRIFVVNKPAGSPSLSAIQIDAVVEDSSVPAGYRLETSFPDGSPIALEVLGPAGVPVPDLIAFDVVVQQR